MRLYKEEFHMKYYVSAKGPRNGDGSRERPYQRIQQAAAAARPGDEVIVAPGLYREWVNPICAGEEDARITYRSEKPGEAVITGAEQVKTWEPYQGNVWIARIPNGVFGAYNPYTTELCGDWYYSEATLHTGEIYLNGKSMYETDKLEEVLEGKPFENSWYPEGADLRWYTEQDGGETVLYANFQGADPNTENVEINVRRNCFYPEKTGVNYITVSGFVIRQAATQWAPPTAYQEGAVGPHWSKGWIIEDCEISDSKCCGISLGKYLQPYNENRWTREHLKQGTQTERDAICQAQIDGWNRETIGSHIVRRCHIHDCGQTGIVGHLGGVFSIIEDNHIHHINTKQQLSGAEIAGIKMHAAIDTIIRRNHIHHCTRGIWLDWQAQGTRVSQNLLHDNIPPLSSRVNKNMAITEDLFIEVSHGPTLVDNNIMLSPYASRICAQGVAYVHNLICGPFTMVGAGTNNGGGVNPRYTPYHVPHRTEVVGFMTFQHGDARFYNNIFVNREIPKIYTDCQAEKKISLNSLAGTKPYDGYPTADEYFAQFFVEGDVRGKENREKYYNKMPVYTGGNIFFNGAQPCGTEQNFAVDTEHEIFVELEEKDGAYRLHTNLYEYLPKLRTPFISSEVLGEAFEPEQRFENPDGSELFLGEDYFGEHRAINPTPGPFENGAEISESLF